MGSRAFALALQADGKIVAVGAAGYGDSFALARFNPDGSLDPSFAGTGGVMTDFGARAAAYGAAIQADGKIVAAGTAGGTFETGLIERTFALARYNTDGSLDASFGTNGKARTRFGLDGAAARGIAVQPDGKIVAAGFARKSFAVARYNPDGSLDTSFGSDGKVRTRLLDRPSSQSASSVAIQADGKIIVAGAAYAGRKDYVAVVRYAPDGSLDAAFGSGGRAITPTRGDVHDLVVQPDGRIVVAGELRLVRYNPDGSLDTSFSEDGVATTRVRPHGVAIQADGMIVVAGSPRQEPFTFAVARYDPAGTLDTSFGSEGSATTDFPGFDDLAYDVAIQADGKIVAAGTTSDINIDATFALARFLAA